VRFATPLFDLGQTGFPVYLLAFFQIIIRGIFMKQNVGSVDKVIRVVLGVALLSLIYFLDGPVRWVGLVGAVLIVTAAISWCPIFAVLGLSSNKGK
jgi:hypothetical protein